MFGTMFFAVTFISCLLQAIQPQYLKAASQDKLSDFLHQFVEDLYMANGKPSPFTKNPEEKAA